MSVNGLFSNEIVFDARDGQLAAEEGLGREVVMRHDPVNDDGERTGSLVQGHRGLTVVQLTRKKAGFIFSSSEVKSWVFLTF